MNLLNVPQGLLALFDEALTTPSDINEHLETLFDLVRDLGPSAHVTEMGTRTGVSTVALLTAQPRTLICYDLAHQREVMDRLLKVKGRTDLTFVQGSTLKVDIEETDILFIDTYHTYAQLKAELSRHAKKVRSTFVFHDTVAFGVIGEDGSRPGLKAAVDEFIQEEFVASSARFQYQHYFHNNGLMVLRRLL